MARPRRSGAPPMSFISFLDIMASLIGILSLIIISLVLFQVDPQAVQAAQREMADSIKRAEELQKIKETTDSLEKEKQRLEALAQELEQIRREMKQVEQQQENMDAGRKQAVALQAQARELKEKMEQLQKEMQEAEQQAQQMQKELDKRKAPREDPQVKVRLAGSGENLDPHFVEVTATGLVIHGMGPGPIVVPYAQIANGPEFKKLMETVKASPKGSIIFLIREDALNMHAYAANIATNNYVRNGKLPLVGKGKVDLSEARKALEEKK